MAEVMTRWNELTAELRAARERVRVAESAPTPTLDMVERLRVVLVELRAAGVKGTTTVDELAGLVTMCDAG